MSEPVTVEALKAADIIPDILPETFSGSLVVLPMTYANDVKPMLGSSITPQSAGEAPRYTMPPGLPADSLYTIVGLDPDAPSRRKPSSRSFIHQMQVNVPASAADVATAGTTHVAYYPPCPPQGSGKHRYVFFLYHQTSAVDVSRLPKYGLRNRRRHKPSDIEKTLKDSGAGDVQLVAVNWYASEWEPWVNEYLRAMYGWIVVPMLWLMKFRI
jgi:phosphatidylethanolamine-binding protein